MSASHPLTDRQRRLLERKGNKTLPTTPTPKAPRWGSVLTLPGKPGVGTDTESKVETKVKEVGTNETKATKTEVKDSGKPGVGTNKSKVTGKGVGTHVGTKSAKPDNRQPDALITDLRAKYPAAFCAPPVPLVIGIYDQVVGALGEEHSKRTIRRALAMWCGRNAYHRAMTTSTHRVNLDGTEAGEVKEYDRGRAVGILHERGDRLIRPKHRELSKEPAASTVPTP